MIFDRPRTITEISPEFEYLRPELEKLFEELVEIKNGNKGGKGTEATMPSGAACIYRGRNVLYALRLKGESLVVKDFKRPHIINRYVYTTLRKSKAARSFLNARQLAACGFDTPAPAAYFEYRRGIELVYSFYVARELSGGSEMRRWEEKPEADKLLAAFADEMVRLHRAGVWIKDFSPGNILYTGEENTGFRFHHVDLNRISFGVKSERKLMRMFRAINLKPSETERLARLYAKSAGKDEEKTARRALRELDKYLRRKS